MKKSQPKYSNPVWPYILSVLMVLVALTLYVFLVWRGNNNVIAPNVVDLDSVTVPGVVSALTGQVVTATGTDRITAVMVDNHPEARPSAGLLNAAIVYEAPVEGDYTRFMAIFGSGYETDKIGPVRSARPYYLDWLAEYGDALYLHCGGSPEALDRIKTEKIFAANEFYFGKYYKRDSSRTAPHNLYTSALNWDNLWTDLGAKHGNIVWEGWKFGVASGTQFNESASGVKISYGNGESAEWRYDKVLNRYGRVRGNAPEADAFGTQLMADNVIIQYVAVAGVGDYGRKDLVVIGSGEARIFRDGKLERGSWKKVDKKSRTRFYAANGEEVTLKPGNTWVQIVPGDRTVTISN